MQRMTETHLKLEKIYANTLMLGKETLTITVIHSSIQSCDKSIFSLTLIYFLLVAQKITGVSCRIF